MENNTARPETMTKEELIAAAKVKIALNFKMHEEDQRAGYRGKKHTAAEWASLGAELKKVGDAFGGLPVGPWTPPAGSFEHHSPELLENIKTASVIRGYVENCQMKVDTLTGMPGKRIF